MSLNDGIRIKFTTYMGVVKWSCYPVFYIKNRAISNIVRMTLSGLFLVLSMSWDWSKY